MKTLALSLLAACQLCADDSRVLHSIQSKPLNRLEAAVQAGPRIHEVNPAAAKPGERPHAYASPGREKHGKPPPPGKTKP